MKYYDATGYKLWYYNCKIMTNKKPYYEKAIYGISRLIVHITHCM